MSGNAPLPMAPLTPEERRLYLAVLLQALRDYCRDSSGIADAEARQEVESAQRDSREFFLHIGRATDLMALCELAGVDYCAVVDRISRTPPSELRVELMDATWRNTLGKDD